MLLVEDLHVSYGHVLALAGVSLRVEAGEIVALVGANGAGKSTVLRTISGLLRPRSGRISFAGARVDGLSPKAIVQSGLSHCPEERKIWPAMTVEENLALGAYTRRDGAAADRDRQRIFAYFPRLLERRRQLAGTLSGGEQQMLAIGRALMSAPKLLMLDEPSLGLSPLLVEDLRRVILDIHRDGTAVLLVEQNVHMALEVAQRAYVIETGRNVVDGRSEDLLKDDSLVRAYLGG
jgi:branched-chain amino acid transport system ATP-binding protein